jgi:hypothetical protein
MSDAPATSPDAVAIGAVGSTATPPLCLRPVEVVHLDSDDSMPPPLPSTSTSASEAHGGTPAVPRAAVSSAQAASGPRASASPAVGVSGTAWQFLGQLPPPMCNHGEPAVERTVLKPGENCGRKCVAGLVCACANFVSFDYACDYVVRCDVNVSGCARGAGRFFVCSRPAGLKGDLNARCNFFKWLSDHKRVSAGTTRKQDNIL